MTIPGYVPAANEHDPEKLARAIRHVFENGASAADLAALQVLPRREVLTAGRTYWVRTDGSDGNDGLSNTAAGAFATIAKAVSVAGGLDLSVHAVTVRLGVAGSYSGATISGPFIGGPGSSVGIEGDPASPGSYVVTTNIVVSDNAALQVRGITLATNGWGLQATTGGNLAVTGAVEFGACTSGHMRAVSGGRITVTTNYTISGGAGHHVFGDADGYVVAGGITVTLTGSPHFSAAFATCTNGYVQPNGNTYSGTATGARYNITGNGVVNTLGQSTTYLPGNAAGSQSTGGQYL